MRIATAVAVVTTLLAASAAHAERQSPRDDSPAPVIAAAEGVNGFAADLYVRLAQGDGNLVFSPYSISAAMAFAMLGAGGDTARDIRRAMHYTDYDTNLHAGMARLARTLNNLAERDSLELHTTDALWADDSLNVTRRYQTHLHRFYNAELRRSNFLHAPDAARVSINDWVANQTNDKIMDLLPSGSITRETQLVVTNAIYFHAPWAHAFPADATVSAPFTRADGSTVDAQLMHVKRDFPYAETDTYQAVELAYKGDELGMLVLLPKEGSSLTDVESAIAPETIADLVTRGAAPARTVDAFIPRFRLTYARTLNRALMDMGMARAFQPDANFSGISKDADLYISMVAHKAYIDVAEEGTEAAAATGIVMKPTSAEVSPSVTFRADHPFVFIIKDNKTGAILFIGRVTDPSA